MSTTVFPASSPLLSEPVADTPEDRETFAERRRILLFEPDPALRRVLAATMLRFGCVVTFMRDLDTLVAALGEGGYDGAIVALETDLSSALRLYAAAPPGIRLAVVALAPPDPLLIKHAPGVRFLQKPFDVRDLLAALNLPERAHIVVRDV